jgi:outer membrane protein TolC
VILVFAAHAETLDLDAAVARALQDGIDARSAALDRASAESILALRRKAGLPDLGLSASAGVGVDADGATPSASASLRSTTALYAGGAIRGRLRSAEAALVAAKAEEERVRQDVVYTVADDLLAVREAEGRLAAAESSLAAERALLDRISVAVAAGARTTADALQQRGVVAQAEATLADARRDLTQARLAMIELLRLEPDADWSFSAPSAGPALEGDARALTSRAAERLPELVVLRADLDAARADEGVARASGRPSLDLGVSGGAAWSPGTAPADLPSASAAVSLDVPLFDRGVTRDAVARASLDREAAELALADAELGLAVAVRSALADREAAEAGDRAATERVAAARAAADVVAQRYEAGAALYTELLAARSSLADAERDAVAAGVEATRARFALAWVVGGL